MCSSGQSVTLRDCASLLSGGTPSKSKGEYWNGDVPWFSAKDLGDHFLFDSQDHITSAALESGARVAPAGAILMLVRGMTLHNSVPIGMLTRDAAFNQDVKAIVPKDGIDGDYLLYWLLGHHHELRALVDSASHGTGRINTDELELFGVHLLAMAEQKQIARVFRALDDKIELNRRMNRTLEAISRVVFKSWFIDFDPVIDNAILNGKPIPDEFAKRAEVRREILTDGNGAEGVASFRHLFPDSFRDSPLGKIPTGWEICELRDLLDLNRESIKPLKHPEEAFDHFSIPAYDAGSPAREVGDVIRSSKYQVPSSAMLISKLNPHIPRVWLPNVSEERRSICSTEFLVCIPRESISREYLYSLLSSSAFLDVFGRMVTGTTGSHQRVRPAAFTAMRVFKPSSELLAAFTESAEPLFAKCAATREESRSLAGTRDALLPQLLSGDLDATKGVFDD